MLLQGKLFVTKQYYASKGTLVSNSFNISKQFKLKNQSSKLENVTQGGGGRKGHKKCHVLFEWPLKS